MDLKLEFCAETVQKVLGLGRKAWPFAANVSEAASVEAVAEQILTATGKVDILVNNAGITKDGLLMRMSEADWDASPRRSAAASSSSARGTLSTSPR